MPRPITIAIAAVMTSLFALVFWQFGMNKTDAASTGPKLEYYLTTTPYLPIQRLEPVY
jgi:hypothetical protein